MPDVGLTQAQYGKAEVRLLHVDRGAQRHEITDLNVSIALAGGLTDTYLTGDNSGVLTTDAQKNTVYAFARKFGVTPAEEFGLRLAGHFAGIGPVERAQVRIEQYGWRRIEADGTPHAHSFERQAGTRVTNVIAHADGGSEVVAGVTDLVLLKPSGSEFPAFLLAQYPPLDPPQHPTPP